MPASSRSSLACISCRSAKSKCDGIVPSAIASSSCQNYSSVLADWPCSRCQRLDRRCHWRAAQRTGRPRRFPNSVETSTAASSSSTLHLSPTLATNSSTVNTMDPLINPDLYDFVTESLKQQDSLNLFSFITDDLDDYSQIQDNESTQNSSNPSDYAIGTAALGPAITLTPTSTSDIANQQSGALLLGIQRYFQSVGKSSPLIGLEAEFMSRFDSCEQILLESMSALGHLFFEGNESFAYSTARQRSLSLYLLEPNLDNDAQKIVDIITALIFLTYIEYGSNDEKQASIYLTRASELAIYYGFNLLDLNSDKDESLLIKLCHRDDQIIETARRVWWELFLADVVIHIATSGKISRMFSSLPVNIVGAPTLPGTSDQEPYQMRIKTALLAAEIMSKGDIQLTSMDSILANLILGVQERWLIYSKQMNQSKNMMITTSEDKESIAAMGQGLLFQTLLMLHAARLHLHRQAWFSNITFDYDNNCSFITSNTLAKTLNDDDDDENQVQMSGSIRSSFEQIINCSSSILSLMQVDSEQHFRQSQQSDLSHIPLVSSNWPFIGCCQMVASYGFALFIAKHNSNNTSLSSTIFEKKKKGEIWKKREMISNMGFAEASLGNLTKIWLVSDVYRKLIHRCRLAFEQSIEDNSIMESTRDRQE